MVLSLWVGFSDGLLYKMSHRGFHMWLYSVASQQSSRIYRGLRSVDRLCLGKLRFLRSVQTCDLRFSEIMPLAVGVER